jgi:hypothetical protein
MASTERKIILLLAGIEPGSPIGESDVLPLDHGLPLTKNEVLIIEVMIKSVVCNVLSNLITYDFQMNVLHFRKGFYFSKYFNSECFNICKNRLKVETEFAFL